MVARFIDIHFHPWLREAVPPQVRRGVEEFFEARMRRRVSFFSVEELFSEMDRLGVEKCVLLPVRIPEVRSEGVSWSGFSNQVVAELVDKYPDRFVGFAFADPLRTGIRDAVKEFERSVVDMGLRGLKVVPRRGLPLNSPKLYPLYAKAEELGVPVLVHAGQLYEPQISLKLTHPLAVDEVAGDFPDLKIVIAHFGSPWIMETLAIVRRHKNVYADTSALRPQLLKMIPWEIVEDVMADKVLFGSDYPLLTHEMAIEFLSQASLSTTLFERVAYQNAKQLLNL